MRFSYSRVSLLTIVLAYALLLASLLQPGPAASTGTTTTGAGKSASIGVDTSTARLAAPVAGVGIRPTPATVFGVGAPTSGIPGTATISGINFSVLIMSVALV